MPSRTKGIQPIVGDYVCSNCRVAGIQRYFDESNPPRKPKHWIHLLVARQSANDGIDLIFCQPCGSVFTSMIDDFLRRDPPIKRLGG